MTQAETAAGTAAGERTRKDLFDWAGQSGTPSNRSTGACPCTCAQFTATFRRRGHGAVTNPTTAHGLALALRYPSCSLSRPLERRSSRSSPAASRARSVETRSGGSPVVLRTGLNALRPSRPGTGGSVVARLILRADDLSDGAALAPTSAAATLVRFVADGGTTR